MHSNPTTQSQPLAGWGKEGLDETSKCRNGCFLPQRPAAHNTPLSLHPLGTPHLGPSGRGAGS